MALLPFKRRRAVIALAVFVLLVLPATYLWFSAPADPKYNGVRLSTYLYRSHSVVGPFTYGNRYQPAAMQRECDEALKRLGPKAAPLLTAWIEVRPSPIRDKLRQFLRKQKVDWPYLTADHQDIVEKLFFRSPAAAVPVAEAFQWQILNGQSRDASRAATLLMWVINSVGEAERVQIASRSGDFANKLIDRFERTGEDVYALTLVGPLLQYSTNSVEPAFRERVLTVSKKARYLDSAAKALTDPNRTARMP